MSDVSRVPTPADPDGPARWQRAGAVAGIVSALLFVTNLALVATSPRIGSGARDVLAHLEANSTRTLVVSCLGALAAVVLVPFIASLKAFVHERTADAEWRWTVTLLAGSAAVSILLAGSALLAAAVVLADQGAHEAAVTAVFAAAKVSLTFSLMPLAAVILANARTMSSSRTPVRWLVKFGIEVGVVAILASGVIFIDTDLLGPGEPAIAVVALFVAIWLIAVAVTMLEGESSAETREAAATRR